MFMNDKALHHKLIKQSYPQTRSAFNTPITTRSLTGESRGDRRLLISILCAKSYAINTLVCI